MNLPLLSLEKEGCSAHRGRASPFFATSFTCSTPFSKGTPPGAGIVPCSVLCSFRPTPFFSFHQVQPPLWDCVGGGVQLPPPVLLREEGLVFCFPGPGEALTRNMVASALCRGMQWKQRQLGSFQWLRDHGV